MAATMFLSAACGGGAKATGGMPFTTSIPASTKVTTLTPSQISQLCSDLTTYIEKTLPTTCEGTGVLTAILLYRSSSPPPSDAELQNACASAYNDCLRPDAGPTGGFTCGSSTFSALPSTCQATVADVQGCLNDRAALYQSMVAAFPSCNSLTVAAISTSGPGSVDASGNAPEPPSCATLNATCKAISM